MTFLQCIPERDKPSSYAHLFFQNHMNVAYTAHHYSLEKLQTGFLIISGGQSKEMETEAHLFQSQTPQS